MRGPRRSEEGAENAQERPLRLFVAADVPVDQRLRLQGLVEPYRDRFPEGRWTAPENQHVTLKFLGATPRSSLERLDEVLAAVASGGRAGEVALTQLGVFPTRRRARVLWAGIHDPGSVLAGVAGALDMALGPRGYRIEKRGFTPHLTLARFKTPVALQGPLPALPEGTFAPFWVERIVLYSSRLHPHGARYEPVASYALGGPAD
jgi:2'-5' RNA ligase